MNIVKLTFVSVLVLAGMMHAQTYVLGSSAPAQGTTASACINPTSSTKLTVTGWTASLVDSTTNEDRSFVVEDQATGKVYFTDWLSVSALNKPSDHASNPPMLYSPSIPERVGTGYIGPLPAGHGACIAFPGILSTGYEAVNIFGFYQ